MKYARSTHSFCGSRAGSPSGPNQTHAPRLSLGTLRQVLQARLPLRFRSPGPSRSLLQPHPPGRWMHPISIAHAPAGRGRPPPKKGARGELPGRDHPGSPTADRPTSPSVSRARSSGDGGAACRDPVGARRPPATTQPGSQRLSGTRVDEETFQDFWERRSEHKAASPPHLTFLSYTLPFPLRSVATEDEQPQKSSFKPS